MKKMSLIVVGAVVLMLFVSAKVGIAVTPACDAARLAKGQCFERAGFVIEAVVDSHDNFPVINASGDSVFTYKVTRTTSKKSLGYPDILVPVCTSGFQLLSATCNSKSCSITQFTQGAGDPLTGFGLGLVNNNTWRWNYLLAFGTQATVSFTLKGRVYASPGAMLVKMGLLGNDASAYGQILAPSCGLITPTVAPPVVPTVEAKQERVGVEGEWEVQICSEAPDASGCPTLVYTCGDASKTPWPKITLAEVTIDQTHLEQLWTDPNPRCPGTYIITGSTKCVTKCYASGYCYKGPPGCGL